MRNLFLSLVFLILSPLFCFSQILTNVTLNGNLTVGNGLSGVGSSTFDMTNSTNYYDLIPLATISQSSFLQTNIFARGVFSTTAMSATITGYSNIYGSFPQYADIGIRVNGSDLQALKFTGSGSQIFTVNFSAGVKTIEVVAGAQSYGSFPNIAGSWPTKIVFNGDSNATLAPPTETSRMVILGDSISCGDDSTNPSLQTWVVNVRDVWATQAVKGSVIAYAYGSGSLHDNCTDSASCQSLANLLTQKLSGATNKFVYIQQSTNDYGLNRWSAASFGTNYALLLADIHANDASIQIYAQTATYRGSESANGSGSTLDDYRTQVTNDCNADSGYCTVVDGKTILSQWSDYNADQLHPSLSGQTTYANFIESLLGI